jgi:hypothetical protein
MNNWYTQDDANNLFGDSDNDLVKLALNSNSSKLFDPECSHYLDAYNDKFGKLRDRPISILEIGVKDGDSLKLWKEYFHPESKIYGIELNPEPLKDFNQSNTQIFYGSQTDIKFLNKITDDIGKVDIIIDDGGHTANQLVTSFNFLFEYCLNDGGTYVMEDLGTSYWDRWSGGINQNGTAINFMKDKVDGLNFRFWKGGRSDYIGKPSMNKVDATFQDKNIKSIVFYKALCFVDKGNNLEINNDSI